jgi:hypothetical protein
MIRKIIASIALLVSASCVFAADDVLTDLTSSRLPTGGVFRVTTDGTNATLTVNKITASTITGDATFSGTTTTITNNLVVSKNTTLTGTTLHTGAATFNGGTAIGAQTGWTGVVTNYCNGFTNRIWIGSGITTNVTYSGVVTP